MNKAEAEQQAIDALLTKFREGLGLTPVAELPEPVNGLDLTGWLLFVVGDESKQVGCGLSEYVAVDRSTGTVQFLGPLGE
jgi:hypothetical protein